MGAPYLRPGAGLLLLLGQRAAESWIWKTCLGIFLLSILWPEEQCSKHLIMRSHVPFLMPWVTEDSLLKLSLSIACSAVAERLWGMKMLRPDEALRTQSTQR